MVSVTSMSRYQGRPYVYPRPDSTELAETVPIALEMFVLIAKATSEDTKEPVHPLSFPIAFAARIHTLWK